LSDISAEMREVWRQSFFGWHHSWTALRQVSRLPPPAIDLLCNSYG